jgi:CheY-like chemotaxis protein
MTQAMWTIMHVDDEAKHRDDIHELLHGEDLGFGEIKVLSLSSFEEATSRLAAGDGDLVVLDLVEGTGGAPDGGAETAGQAAFERIRAARFVPVVFYTGWGHQLTELADELPLVEVVGKGAGGIEGVNTAVQRFFNEGLPQLNRSLAFHVDEVQRVWMWQWLAVNWPQLCQYTDPVDRAHMVARRLAREMSGPAVAQLAAELGGQPSPSDAEGVHPMRFYIMPPLTDSRPTAGDILRGAAAGRNGWWILLTPSCDFARLDPAEVMLAECELLSEQAEHKAFCADAESKNRRRQLGYLLANNRPPEGRQQDRYHHLPAAMAVPGLVADLKRVVSVGWDEFDALDRIASLDAPYAEALLHQFAKYVGRLGTPDLDVDMVLDAIAASPSQSGAAPSSGQPALGPSAVGPAVADPATSEDSRDPEQPSGSPEA